MITINRDEFRRLLAGTYCMSNQSYSKEEAAKFIEGGMTSYDLLVRSFNKVEVKDPVKPENDKLEHEHS